MTTNYHTPIPEGAAADADTFNSPLGQMDEALTEALLEERDGHIIQDEGVDLAQQARLDFVGSGVTVTNEVGKTKVTILGGITDHGALSGLSDDDHPQYLLRSGVSGLFAGRLSGQAGAAVPLGDLTALASLVLTPYKGRSLPIYDGSDFTPTTFAEMTLTLNATPHPANTNHDVFFFNDAGTKRIGSVKWRNSGQAITAATNANPCVITANSHGIQANDVVSVLLIFTNTIYYGEYTASSVATNTITFNGINSTSDGAFKAGFINCRGVGSGTPELEIVNGVHVNKNQITAYYSASSATVAARYGTYLGTFRASASAQTESGKRRRFIWNAHNRESLGLLKKESTDSWAYSTATYRQVRADATNQLEIVAGLGGQWISLQAFLPAYNSAGGVKPRVAIGESNATVPSGNGNITSASGSATNQQGFGVASVKVQILPGYWYFTWLERDDTGSGTTTFMGDNGLPDIVQAAMMGDWQC